MPGHPLLVTGGTLHLIVKRPVAPVRSGPATPHRIEGKATYGDVVRTRKTWCSSAHAARDGTAQGDRPHGHKVSRM